MGNPHPGETRRPRDILAKFHSFKVKEAVLAAARTKGIVSFQNFSCSLYQDLAPATLARRRAFRPITSKLRDEKIRYHWTYPFGISFEYCNKQRHVSDLREGMQHLGLPIEESPTTRDGPVGAAGGPAGSAAWSVGTR